jgi:hypothetical protein
MTLGAQVPADLAAMFPGCLAFSGVARTLIYLISTFDSKPRSI